MSNQKFWPQTLSEFKAEIPALELDVTKPPYSRTRYTSLAVAEKVAEIEGTPLYRDDFTAVRAEQSQS